MSGGTINSKVILLLFVLAFGAGGYLWFSQMYKPAVALKVGAQTSAATAQQQLETAKGQLAAAQKRLEDAKVEGSKLDESMARLAKARTGVPPEELIDDAAIVIQSVAREAGVETRFVASGNDGTKTVTVAPASAALQGATALDFEFEGGGTYAEFQHFFYLLESSAEVEGDSLYARGRLFNIEGFRTPENEEADDTNPDTIVLGKDEIRLLVTVRIYTSSNRNSEGVGATVDNAAAPDAAGAPATPAPTDPNATTPPAAGAAPAADAATAPAGATPAAGTTPAPTTPAATPPADGAATPTPAPGTATGGLQ